MLAASGGSSFGLLVVYILIGLGVWFFLVRPRRDRRKDAREQAFRLGMTNMATHTKEPEVNTHAPTSQGSSNQTRIDELAKIAELHAKGILTDEEFQAQKQKIIGK